MTPRTIVCQAPLSLGFPGKSTGEGCHFLLQGIFPTPGLNLGLLCFSCIAGEFFTAELLEKPLESMYNNIN